MLNANSSPPSPVITPLSGKKDVSPTFNRSMSSPNIAATLLHNKPELSPPINHYDPFNPLFKMIRYLQARGLTTEGLFLGENVDQTEVERVKKIVVKEGDNLHLANATKDSIAVGEILKQFLLSREPLLTFEMYDSFLLIDTISTEEGKIIWLERLLGMLPKSCFEALKQTFTLFFLLLQTSQSNKLTIEILAGKFGHIFLRPKEVAPYMQSDEAAVQAIIGLLMEQYESLVKVEETRN